MIPRRGRAGKLLYAVRSVDGGNREQPGPEAGREHGVGLLGVLVVFCFLIWGLLAGCAQCTDWHL